MGEMVLCLNLKLWHLRKGVLLLAEESGRLTGHCHPLELTWSRVRHSCKHHRHVPFFNFARLTTVHDWTDKVGNLYNELSEQELSRSKKLWRTWHMK